MKKGLLSFIIGTSLFVGCSHQDVKKADLPDNANAAQEIQKLEANLGEAKSRNVDLLAPAHFKKSEKYFKEAQEDFQDKDSNSKILESVAYSKSYLSKSEELAATSRKYLSTVVESRQAAVQAQAETYYPKDLRVLDNDLRDLASEYESGKKTPVSSEDVSELRQNYALLQAKAMKSALLGHANALITNAKKDGAKKYVPNVLEQADGAYSNAEMVIDKDINNQARLQAAVAVANEQAERVSQLTIVARDSKNESPEQIALAIENKNKEIQSRSQALQNQQGRTQDAIAALKQSHSNLMDSKVQLANTKLDVAELKQKDDFQQAIEESRKSFGPNEAEAYQQGDSLLIRLKSLNFASSRSELPSASYETLKKVKAIVEKIGPSRMVIEGHTDSVGSAEINKKISKARAETVKSYFLSQNLVTEDHVETLGSGAEKPISRNNSSAGRAQNRRVDIIIKPEGVN